MAKVSAVTNVVDARAPVGAKAFSRRLTADRWSLAISVPGERAGDEPAIDAGCVAALVIAVLTQGVAEGLGLPGKVQLVADFAALALLVGSLVVIVRRGLEIRIPLLVIAFGGVLLVAALRSDDLLRMIVSARNFLLLPALALVLGNVGPNERRDRVVTLTVLALAAVEFALTIPQAYVRNDVDLVVGTFGDYAGPSLAFMLLTGTSLALGVYATRCGGAGWLLFALLLPLFSVWAAIRAVPPLLPAVGLAVALTAWWAMRKEGSAEEPRRPKRAAAIAVTVLAGTALVFAGYAVFRPADFELFTNSEKRSHYLDTADLNIPADSSSSRSQDSSSSRSQDSSSSRSQDSSSSSGNSTDGSLAGEPTHSAGSRPEVPGRGEQYKTAFRLIDGNPMSALFGNGLGATTYALNLGIEEPAAQARIAGYSDFGTAVVEVGWLGLALIVCAGAALFFGCMAAARRAPSGSWMRALLVAYPGVLVAMGGAVMVGNPFRNAGSATVFWVLTGLALASLLELPRSSRV